jgi:4-hydroxybenzoate polyprenyltransferase
MLRLLLESMRPRQWTKNVFVFAALIFDHKLFDPVYFLRTLAAFAMFCALSSAVYLINDLADVERDRQHPLKRNRPIASGRLARRTALVAGAALPLIVVPLGFALDWRFGLVALAYFAENLLYSLWLKRLVIVDVFMLAVGFVLRVAAGVLVVDAVRFSPWLYICMTLLALFLGFGKRRQELVLTAGQGNSTRHSLDEYTIPLLDHMIGIVTAAILMAYSLYTFSASGLPINDSMMLTIPFVLYGIFRYLYLIHVRGEGGAPDELALRDRPLQVAVVLWGLTSVIIMYGFAFPLRP